jgi:hypothetical protein
LSLEGHLVLSRIKLFNVHIVLTNIKLNFSVELVLTNIKLNFNTKAQVVVDYLKVLVPCRNYVRQEQTSGYLTSALEPAKCETLRVLETKINEYQESSCGVKRRRRMRLTASQPLDVSEPYRPPRAITRLALLLLLFTFTHTGHNVFAVYVLLSKYSYARNFRTKLCYSN